MPQTIFIGGLPHWLQKSGVTLTAASEVGTLVDDNLLDPQISLPWRSAGLTVDSGIWWDLGKARPFDNVWLVNHNLRERAWTRLAHGSASLSALLEQVDVNGSANSGGSLTVTGSHTAVDEDVDDPTDGDVMNLAGGDGWLRFDFATPSSNPLGGGNLQVFRVKWKKNSGSSYFGDVALYEGGTFRQICGGGQEFDWADPGGNLYDWDDPDTAYHYAYFFWNASNLGTASGAAVQMRIDVEGTGNFDIVAVDWICTKTVSGATVGPWQQVVGLPIAWGGFGLDEISSRSFVRSQPHLLTSGGAPAAVTARYGRLDVLAIGHPDGYVQAGRLELGLSFSGLWTSGQVRIKVTDKTRVDRSKGGQVWRKLGPAWRGFEVPLKLPPKEGVQDILGALYRGLGLAGDFGLIYLPDDSNRLGIQAAWVMLAGEDHEIEYELGARGDDSEGNAHHVRTTLRTEEVL